MIRQRMDRVRGLALVGIAATFFGGGATLTQSDFDLPTVISDIASRYDEIEHLSIADVAALDPSSTIFVDTRPASEFDVSHIAGAVQVAPNARTSSVLAALPSDLTGKTIVFYCSVGERSSRLGVRAARALTDTGAVRVVNLRGGLFQWANEGRLMVDADGPTDKVHPFNRKWGRLIDDPSRISAP